jgi:putative colanic acid biosynthesis acetyltransferase WcaF
MLPKPLWSLIGAPLVRATFHNWYGLRRAILRAWGARLAPTARIRPSARISSPWNLAIGEESSLGDGAILDAHAPITIGRFVTISQHARLCAAILGPGGEAYAKHPGPAPITIGDDAWISTDAFVAPGVVVGEGAILGSKAVAYRDLEPWTIYGGEPAKALRPRERVVELTRASREAERSDPPTR